MALATADDVSIAIGRPLSGDETERADMLLELASRSIESETGRRFTPGDYTIGRKVRAHRVTIPAVDPVVTAVRSIDQRTGVATAITGWTLRESVLFGLRACYVEVDFTTDTAVPDAIVSLAAGVVGGLITSPAAGVSAETAGPYQVTFGNNSGRLFYSASDQMVLDSYRIPKPSLSIL